MLFTFPHMEILITIKTCRSNRKSFLQQFSMALKLLTLSKQFINGFLRTASGFRQDFRKITKHQNNNQGSEREKSALNGNMLKMTCFQ